MTIFSSSIVASVLLLSSMVPMPLTRKGYIVPKETLSPSHQYGFLVPLFDSQDIQKNAHNSLVTMRTGKVITAVNAPPVFDRPLNHIALIPPCWSTDSSLVLWMVQGKWAPEAVVLIKLKKDAQVWQFNVLTAFQKEILIRTKIAAPEQYEAAKQANAGAGNAFPDGFLITVEPVNKRDTKRKLPLQVPLPIHVTLTSNPKKIEGIPNLNAELEGVVKEGGIFEVKSYHLQPGL